MKIKPVKTAVIGCGMISDIYLQNLRDTFYIIDLVGCADMVSAKAHAQAEKYGIKEMTVDEILSDSEIELVLNLTYPTSHYEVSHAILSAGKNCYSEKMMCLTLQEADELKRVANEKGVRFAVAPDTFLGASQQTSRYLIDKGIIGDPVSIEISLTRSYQLTKTTEDDAWRKFSVMHEGGGIPYDMGGYYLNQIFNIFGPIDKVTGFARTRNKTRPYLNPRHEKFNDPFVVNTINTISSTFVTDSGVTGTLRITSECTTRENRFVISGTEGELYLGDPNNFGDPIYIVKNRSEKMQFPLAHPYRDDSRGIGAADMAWAIRCDRPCRISYEMGRAALEFVKAIEESEKDGCIKTLETKFERPVPISSEHYSGTSSERNLFLY